MNRKHLAFFAATIPALLAVAYDTQTLAQSAQQPAKASPRTAYEPRAVAALAAQSGIWKAVVPPVKMAGVFDDHDPIGLAAGKMIPADCSINWTDPDTQKLYCFSSATSLVYFLNAPHANIARATKGWLRHIGS